MTPLPGEAFDAKLDPDSHLVLLACGGFERNEQMRIKYQRSPITADWTLDAAANTGDGIVTAEKLGAALDVREDVWWGPTIPLPNGPWFALSERNAPGSIIVNTAGQRYMNEALAHGGHPSPYGGTYGQGPPVRTCHRG